MNRIIGLAAGALLLAGTAPALAQERGYFDHYHAWGAGWGMLFGPLMMIVFLAAVVALAVAAARWLGAGGPSGGQAVPPPGGRSALDVLRDRFARGEIDKDEFEERRRLLAD